MTYLRRRFFVASLLAALAVVSIQPAQACIDASQRQQIVFDDTPDNIPVGLTASHFHLTNQVPEFALWREPRDFSLKDENPRFQYLSFVGMGASINPWTHWLTSRLPEWLVSRPKYMPMFALTGSCTVNFWPLESKIDMELILVGETITLTDGSPVFAAASYRKYDDQWVTYKGRGTEVK